jgi:hypothetical protein
MMEICRQQTTHLSVSQWIPGFEWENTESWSVFLVDRLQECERVTKSMPQLQLPRYERQTQRFTGNERRDNEGMLEG